MPTLLAVAYGGGHLNALLPVVRLLRRRPGWRVELLALTTAGAACAAAGEPFVGFQDFPQLQDDRSRAHGLRLAGAQAPNPVVPHEESVAYLGANWRDLEDAAGAAGAVERFAREGRQAFLPTASLGRIIDAVRPDVVLATSAPRAERAAVEAAGLRGIPSVVVVDLFGLAERGWLARPGYGRRVCVLGPAVRDLLVAAGRPVADLVCTGNPAFDRLGDPALAQRGAALRTARGWTDRQVVLWASQPEPADPAMPRRVEAALAQAMAADPRRLLLVRPHPNDLYELPAVGPQLQHSTRADDLGATLAAADAVVTMTSTVGLEAALIGRPVVTWDRSANTADAPYSRLGLSLGVEALEDLPAALAAALSGQAPRPALPPVGGAAERVAAEVVTLA